MHSTATRIPYRQTNAFSKIALDYIDQADPLRPFFAYPAGLQGIQQAMEARRQFKGNRPVLVEQLTKQYEGTYQSPKLTKNIQSLLSENTFTVTTAHQNNIFTGPLYFIYKIIHAIRLADHLNESFPADHFVPVFYMGTEDADLDELNHIYLGGEKLTWNTSQTGAVGRMKIDKDLVKLLDRMEGELTVLPHGKEIMSALREHYREGMTIQQATFGFVHNLFNEYGLLILLPDNPALKKQMIPVFEDDLRHQAASGIVEQSAAKLEEAGYKVQANPREINLFYLSGDKRERIIKQGTKYKAQGTGLNATEEEIRQELAAHPERFSPNVILRGLFQETILPNIIFIGGGGETAYWLQLKDLFAYYKVPFPMLVLRNSFLLVEKKWQDKIAHLGFTTEDFFQSEQELLNRWVARESENQTKLNGSLSALEKMYETFKQQAAKVDTTLEKHVEALKSKTVYRLQELEKKMLRAEKRKFTDQQRQIHAVKEHLFPGGGLQERYDNMSYYYAKWGKEYIAELYRQSLNLEQEFVILTEA
jgi:bacillithiol biosynthesis cysteine-adding enzyme BshC